MMILEKFVIGISSLLHWFARFAIVGIMILTCFDVLLRYFFNRPIIGTYDLVGLFGAMVIGFSIPKTSLEKGHIIMEFLITNLPVKLQIVFNIVTRCLAI